MLRGAVPAAMRHLERGAAEGRRFDVLLVDADLGAPLHAPAALGPPAGGLPPGAGLSPGGGFSSGAGLPSGAGLRLPAARPLEAV